MTDKLKINAGLISAIIILSFSSCDLINPVEPVPAYIHIPKSVLTTDPVKQGSAAHGIVDAWVFVDDQLQGLYELPVTFPILLTGEQKLDIRAGIKNNGTGGNRIFNPFFTTYSVTTDLEPNENDTIIPQFDYKPGIKFAYMENFESGNSLKVNKSLSSVDTMYRIGPTSPETFEGAWSGLIDLGSGSQYITCESQSEYELPGQGAELMLEMNYKTNVSFDVGVVLNNISGSAQTIIYTRIVTINAVDASWKKIYINLKDDVSYVIGTNPTGINRFRVFLRTSNTDANLVPKIYLDNLKLLHFE